MSISPTVPDAVDQVATDRWLPEWMLGPQPMPPDAVPALPREASVGEVLAGLEPGVTAIAFLRGLRGEELSEAERIEVLKAWEAQHGWLTAQLNEALLAVTGPEPSVEQMTAGDARARLEAGVVEDWAQAEVGAALRLSPRSAANRIGAVRRAAAALPQMSAALAAGTVGWRHVLTLLDVAGDLPDEQLRSFEARVVDKARSQPVGRFARSVRRALARFRPVEAAQAAAEARTGRTVWLQPQPDGMAVLAALLPAEAAQAAFQVVDAIARGGAGTDATGAGGEPAPQTPIDVRRADAFVDLLLRGDLGAAARPGRVPVQVQLVMDVATALGLADEPAELVGYGPLPAPLARELAADASWRRLVTDPFDGHLLDYGRRTYRPPTALADYIRTRDRHCRFPGCPRRAARCDIDHTVAYAAGGATAATNCACLCRHHHRLKTHTRWQLELADDATATWTSPTGHVYTTQPPPPPDTG